MRHYDHFIDGAWYAPNSGETIESIDPATGEAWAHFARDDNVDVDKAVQAAHRAFTEGDWSSYSTQQRVEGLISLADLLQQRWQELVEAEVRDNGKRVVEVNGQFAGLHSWYRYFAQQMLDVESRQLKNQIPGVACVHRSNSFSTPAGQFSRMATGAWLSAEI